jgi:broad specificity phosphatase PhoE
LNLFLIRHAESRNNICKSDQERVADPEITANGRLQSIFLADFLKKGLHLCGTEFEENEKPFDQIFCSAMKRSLETVSPVGVEIGLKPEVWLDIHEVGGIYEFNSDFTEKIGLSGLNRKQIHHNFPEYVLPGDINDDGWWNKSAETLPEISLRVERVLNIIKDRADKNVFLGLVTHGAFISSFLCSLFHLNIADGIAFQSHNCSISRLTFERNKKVTIQYLNFYSYLPEHLRVPRPECEI